MLLKREYAMPEGWEPERDAEGRVTNAPPLKQIHVKHTGTHPEQQFSRRLVDAGLHEGWISLGQGKLTLHTAEGDLAYTIVRVPGTYCCYCNLALGDDPSGVTGRDHVALMHAGESCDDQDNPAGYRVTHAYECVLDADTHAKWQVPPYATVSHSRWKEEPGSEAKPTRRRASKASQEDEAEENE